MTTQPVLEIGTNKSQVISLLSILIFLLSNINWSLGLKVSNKIWETNIVLNQKNKLYI